MDGFLTVLDRASELLGFVIRNAGLIWDSLWPPIISNILRILDPLASENLRRARTDSAHQVGSRASD
jgi:hypothetical protein